MPPLYVMWPQWSHPSHRLPTCQLHVWDLWDSAVELLRHWFNTYCKTNNFCMPPVCAIHNWQNWQIKCIQGVVSYIYNWNAMFSFWSTKIFILLRGYQHLKNVYKNYVWHLLSIENSEEGKSANINGSKLIYNCPSKIQHLMVANIYSSTLYVSVVRMAGLADKICIELPCH